MPFELSKKSIADLNSKLDISKFSLAATDAIINVAKAYTEADVHVVPGSHTYKVMKQEGQFARVNVASQDGGGYYLILKKVYEIWIVIASGQDLPGKDAGEKYGLPESWYSKEY